MSAAVTRPKPDVEIRLFRWDDLPGLIDLMNAALMVDGGDYPVTVEQLKHYFASPRRQPESTCVVAVRPSGQIVGFGCPAFEDDRQVWVGGNVHPGCRRRGIGTRLVRAVEDRVRDWQHTHGKQPVHLRYFVSEGRGMLATLLHIEGYQAVRAAYIMRIDLDRPFEAPPLPDGMVLRPFIRERDAQAVYRADREAFREHWGYSEESFDAWSHELFDHPHYDPSLWLVAWGGDEVAGFLIGRRYSESQPQTGWIDILGVRPAWRRRGLASALLGQAFHEFWARDYQQVDLGVDADNTTHAVRLYERVGMRVHRRDQVYEKVLEPGGEMALS
ncbi:MAG: GNAT family N-acetyltransferase [Chloroflexi bacterium]|nr:GNAT family N-acetyltransferase [Chloroflexota bacterium]